MAEGGQGVERRLHVGSRQALVERGLQAQAHRGERRAQLVRGVGSQRAFGVERPLQPAEQPVDMLAHRVQLGRQVVEGDRRQVAAAAPGDLAFELLDHAQLAPGDPAQHQRQERQHREQRDHEAEQRAIAGLAPLGQGVGELEIERPGRMDHGKDAPRSGVGEAGAQGHREGRRRRLARAHQHPRPGVRKLKDHRVVVDDRFPREQRQAGRIELAARARLIEVVHGDVDHPVRALDHLVVEVLVDLPIDVPGRADDAAQPDAADPKHQGARQPVGQTRRATATGHVAGAEKASR
jgi:hypothetical protein